MGDIATKGNRLTKRKGPHGHASQPHLSVHAKGGRAGKFGGGRTNLLEQLGRVEAEPSNPNRRAEISRVHGELNRGYAKGGKVGRPQGRKSRDSGTQGKDVPTMAAEGGRIGLKKGGKPWGTGPKPGSHEFMMQDIHKRKGKAIGGAVKKALKKVTEPQGVFKPKGVKGKGSDELRANLKGLRSKRRSFKTHGKDVPTMAAEGGRIGLQDGSKRFVKGTKSVYDDDKYIGEFTRREFMDYKQEKHPNQRKQKRIKNSHGGIISLKKGGKADKKWIQKAVDPKHKGYCTPMTKKTCTPARKALARTFKKKAKTGWS